ncbi:MAG: hypothetical protein JJD92_03055 [Frankiaceae bacterium]|nr:hypothetical protein [Frankiaceae bacterium]
MTWLARYRAVVRDGGVASAFLASLFGRISLAMTGLAILLVVQDATGSYGAAGLVSAAYALAFAVSAPARARSADRRGPVPVMIHCSVIGAAALVVLAGLAAKDAPVVVLALAAVVGGAFVPPLGSVMRALWAARLPASSLPTAYSLESVLVELCFVVGPGLVAGIAVWTAPAGALVASALISLAGGLGMAATPGLRAVRPDAEAMHLRGGPLTSPAVRSLLLTIVWVGTSFGATEVAMPAFVEDAGARPAAAGLLLVVWSIGSVIGGIMYGALPSARPQSAQMPVLVTMLAAASVLPLVAPGPIVMGIALLVYGTTIAPFMACNAVLLGSAAPRGTTTEAFAWSSSMIFAGIALGSATAGALIDRGGPTAGLAVTAVAGALTLTVSLLSRRRLPVS